MSLERIAAEGKEIVLVGTAHVSQASIELVKSAIEAEKPDCVGVELDKQRFSQLKAGEKWLDTDLARVVKEGKTYLFLVNILLSNMQRKLGKDLGVKPGMEMIEAIKLAEEKRIPVGLVDRDVGITLKRAMNAMGLVEKAKLLFEVLVASFQEPEPLKEEDIEKLKEKDTLNALMQELGQKMPSVKKVLVDERDLFIAQKILQMPGKKVLVVLGAGHLEGVKRNLGERQGIAGISVAPKGKNWLNLLKYAVPIALVGLLAYGFYAKGIETTLQIIALWFLINGGLSALGAAAARAHPSSIATAFLAAPFTSLHPALAAGWFAAAVEMKVRCPKVRDFNELRNLESYSDFTKNNVTRVLLVAAYSNLGSTIGTIIALPFILSILG